MRPIGLKFEIFGTETVIFASVMCIFNTVTIATALFYVCVADIFIYKTLHILQCLTFRKHPHYQESHKSLIGLTTPIYQAY